MTAHTPYEVANVTERPPAASTGVFEPSAPENPPEHTIDATRRTAGPSVELDNEGES